MSWPLISIITIVFNGVKHIEQCIQSVLQQDYPHYEYIIIDGGSTDGTLEIIERYKSNIKHIVSEKDKGIYDAMNKGLEISSGELIGIINADDYYEPDTLSFVSDCYINEKPQIIHGNMIRIDQRNNSTLLTPYFNRKPKDMWIYHPTVFVNRSAYATIGHFNTQYKIAADFDLMLRAHMHNMKFSYIDQPLANYRAGGKSSHDCTSYKEGIKILKQSNATNSHMVVKYVRCIVKKTLKRFLNLL